MKAILIALILLPTRLFSCFCIPPPIETAIANADIVFIAQYISHTIDTNFFLTTGHGVDNVGYANFKVVKYMGGFGDFSPVISILSSGSFCDYNFSYAPYGTEFIIYAKNITKYSQFHFLTAELCSQTKLTSEITDDYELMLYNDKSQWVVPKPLDPRYSLKDEKFKQSQPWPKIPKLSIGILAILVLINLLLTLYLIVIKK